MISLSNKKNLPNNGKFFLLKNMRQ